MYTSEVSNGGTRTQKLKQKSKRGTGKKTVAFDEGSNSDGESGDGRAERRQRRQNQGEAEQEMPADASKRTLES